MLATRLNRFWLRPTLFAVIGSSGLMLLQAQSSCETGPIQPVINITNSNCNVNGATGDCSNSTANGGAGGASDPGGYGDYFGSDTGWSDSPYPAVEGQPCVDTFDCLTGLDQCTTAACDEGICRLSPRTGAACAVTDSRLSCLLGQCMPTLRGLWPAVCTLDLVTFSSLSSQPIEGLEQDGNGVNFSNYLAQGACFPWDTLRCFVNNDPNPANLCQYCDASSTSTSYTRRTWRIRDNGYVCAPGKHCASGQCVDDVILSLFQPTSFGTTGEETTETDDSTSDTGTSTTDTTTEATNTTTDGEGSSGDTTTDTTTNATSTTTDGEGSSGDTTGDTSTTGDSTGTTTGE